MKRYFYSFYLSMILLLSVALVAFSLAKAIVAIDYLNQ